MSKFRRETEEPPEPGISGTIMYGAFSCGECDLVVTEASHNFTEEKLSWKCPNGHVTAISFKI